MFYLPREPACQLTDEYIGMRAIEHVIPNCPYGNHRYYKCVVNHYSLFTATERTELWTESPTLAADYILFSAMFYSAVWWVVMDSIWQ